MKYKCPKCGETENLHYNLDYSKQHRPILNAVCNKCGTLIGARFDPERPIGDIIKGEEMWFMAEQNQKLGLYDPPYVSDDFQIGPDGAYEHTDDFPTKPGFVERRMAQGKANNDKLWNEIYEQYSSDQYPAFGGPFTDSISFIDWLKENYIAPERIEKAK